MSLSVQKWPGSSYFHLRQPSSEPAKAYQLAALQIANELNTFMLGMDGVNNVYTLGVTGHDDTGNKSALAAISNMRITKSESKTVGSVLGSTPTWDAWIDTSFDVMYVIGPAAEVAQVKGGLTPEQ
ncbi:hypothetical protein BGZ81_003126, partial [Podila clonocystis]